MPQTSEAFMIRDTRKNRLSKSAEKAISHADILASFYKAVEVVHENRNVQV